MDSNRKESSASNPNGIDHRMGIIKSYRKSPSSKFLALMLQMKKLKELNEEEIGKKTNGLAEDCTSCIFLCLSIDDLQRSSSVCKFWNSIIKEQSFIEEHLHQSESGLLCLKINHHENAQSSEKEKVSTLSVEYLLNKQSGSLFPKENLGEFRRRYSNITTLHFLEIKDGVSLAEVKDFNITCSGRVLCSCNGLVLLDNMLHKNIGLVVINPATRKLTPLPAGTIVSPNKESYALAFKSSTNEHIALHFFEEKSGYVSCECLTIEKRKWAMVKGPRSGIIIPLNHKLVFANNSIHWIYSIYSILLMDIEQMKFRLIPLPKPKGLYDGIIELGDFLCFVTHEPNQIDVWALKGDSKESWIKQQTIYSGVLQDMIPLFGSRFDRWIVFNRPRRGNAAERGQEEEEGGVVRLLFIYDFGLGVMNKVRTKHSGQDFNVYIPHVNSLLCC